VALRARQFLGGIQEHSHWRTSPPWLARRQSAGWSSAMRERVPISGRIG